MIPLHHIVKTSSTNLRVVLSNGERRQCGDLVGHLVGDVLAGDLLEHATGLVGLLQKNQISVVFVK